MDDEGNGRGKVLELEDGRNDAYEEQEQEELPPPVLPPKGPARWARTVLEALFAIFWLP